MKLKFGPKTIDLYRVRKIVKISPNLAKPETWIPYQLRK